MARKMHDIRHPKKETVKKEPVKKTRVKSLAAEVKKPEPVMKKAAPKPVPKPVQQEKSFDPAKGKPAKAKKPGKFPWIYVFAGCLLVLVLAGVYLFFKLPKADIEIWPKQASFTLQETVTADTAANAPDIKNNIIAAQYVEVTKQASQSFPATGLSSDQGNATGTITVYNKISPSTPFTLIKGTHFLSDSGLFFVTLSRVIVPAAKGSTPGSISVQVQAEQSGSNYNIAASNFSVPKLNGTTYYYDIYGVSTAAMSGGYTGNAKEISSDDLQSAGAVLTKQLLAQAKSALQTKIGPSDVLLDGAMTNTIVSSGTDAKAGAIADNFTEQASVKVSALVFKKADLLTIITGGITAKLPADTSFLANTINPNYTSQSLDPKGAKMTIVLAPSVETYAAMNINNLVTAFAGKSAPGIKSVLDQLYPNDISQLKVNFWPFWVTSAPSNTGRIKVNLNF